MPTDLAELFSRDPLKLTRPDLVELTTAMRAQRGQFALGNMKAGKTPKAPTEKQKQMSVLAGKLELKL